MTAPGDLVAEAGVRAPPPRRTVMIAVAVVVALAVTALVSFRLGARDTPQAAPTTTPEPTATGEPTVSEIYASVVPSLVAVEMRGPDANLIGRGTGFIANAEGVILTALHIVNRPGTIRVTFADGTPADATVLAADPANDIAALAPNALPTVVIPAVLGSSGRLSVGDDVIAIGNPLGLTGSASTGVVSGLERATVGQTGANLSGLIQFDAAVNPGSSGGPLVNDRGETVGVVVALANPTTAGTFIGIGFAVPIGTAITAGGAQGPQQ
jgi:putative serine protease PepD